MFMDWKTKQIKYVNSPPEWFVSLTLFLARILYP